MIKMLGKIIAALCCFLFVSAAAYAGTLTIEGESKVNFTLKEDKVLIEGTYDIANHGDETAQNVFPLFELGSWKWAGEGRSIGAGKSESWTVKESIGADRLGCIVGRDCNLKPPAPKGYFAVRVLRMYEDTNGHPFSAPDVLRTYLGDIDGEDRAALRVPSLVQTITCGGNGQNFDCDVLLKNTSSSPLTVTVSLQTTRELEIEGEPQTSDIAPGASREISWQLKNFNGLSGSTYPVLSIAEWEDKGLRNSLLGSAPIAIEEISHATLYLVLGGLSFVLALGLLYFFVFKK